MNVKPGQAPRDTVKGKRLRADHHVCKRTRESAEGYDFFFFPFQSKNVLIRTPGQNQKPKKQPTTLDTERSHSKKTQGSKHMEKMKQNNTTLEDKRETMNMSLVHRPYFYLMRHTVEHPWLHLNVLWKAIIPQWDERWRFFLEMLDYFLVGIHHLQTKTLIKTASSLFPGLSFGCISAFANSHWLRERICCLNSHSLIPFYLVFPTHHQVLWIQSSRQRWWQIPFIRKLPLMNTGRALWCPFPSGLFSPHPTSTCCLHPPPRLL